MSEDRFVVILAGGSGTRFWPLSRDAKPKQLLDLVDGVTLIGWVARHCPDAVMAVVTADQVIRDEAEFRRVLEGAFEVAGASRRIVTLGVKPTWPCPGYGYIERGRAVEERTTGSGVVPYEVIAFREKPAPEEAAAYLEKGGYTWNAGMFIWSVAAVRAELERHAPELAAFVADVAGAEDVAAVLAEGYARLPKISIDYALMEKLETSYNVEATFDWDDVGSWLSVANYLSEDDAGNRYRAEMTAVEAENNVVFSDTGQQVALLGVRDLIVVQTADALLVADRSSADSIKKLVEQLPGSLR